MVGSYHREIGSLHFELDLHWFLGEHLGNDSLWVRAESICPEAVGEIATLVLLVIPIDAVEV